MDILEQLGQAATATSTVAKGVRAEQLVEPTPCAQWDVQALMNHMIGSFGYFAARAEGKDPGAHSQPASSASFERTVELLVQGASSAAAGWKQPGALERKVQSPMGELNGEFMANITLAEMVMHGWDLARATGQPMPLDEGLAEEMLAAARANIRPEARQTAFGPEQPAPSGTTALDQLAAFLGRKI